MVLQIQGKDKTATVDTLDYSPNYFETFKEAIAMGHLEPARNNLYEIVFNSPLCMISTSLRGNTRTGWLPSDANQRNIKKNLSLFANNVTIPSRNVTTTEAHVHGMNRSYASGQSPTDLDVTFITTKDQQHRAYFEQWMHNCASDADNTVGIYEQYVTQVDIIKWEGGSNVWLTKIAEEGSNVNDFKIRMNAASAVYRMYGVFPKNLGTQSLNNDQRTLMELNIQFQMERYRFDTANDGRFNVNSPQIVRDSSNLVGTEPEGTFRKLGV
tara:strand:- start:2822 stop:3628 length:807 start_codon:yes stop_codon:yes gene_type:complete